MAKFLHFAVFVVGLLFCFSHPTKAEFASVEGRTCKIASRKSTGAGGGVTKLIKVIMWPAERLRSKLIID